MGRLARIVRALLLLGVAWAALTGTWALAVLLAVLAGGFPLAEYIVSKDRDLREAGSDHTSPPGINRAPGVH